MLGRITCLLIVSGVMAADSGLRGDVSMPAPAPAGLNHAERFSDNLLLRKSLPLSDEVRFLKRHQDGYAVAETANFQIFHNQKRDLVERIAKMAETSRANVSRKWFGADGEDWKSKCKLYLHSNRSSYMAETSVWGAWGHALPGLMPDGQLIGHRIHVNCISPRLVADVVPHEVSHVVLAGHFGTHRVPRWADEGMAVLAESPEGVKEYLDLLPKLRREEELFDVETLIGTEKISHIRSPEYYAQGASLVEFLTAERGPRTFVRFLRDALAGNYPSALKRHYSIRDFKELNRRWLEYAFGEERPPQGLVRNVR